MLDKLSEIHDRYLEVEKLISSPDAMNDMKSYIQYSKEYKEIFWDKIEYLSAISVNNIYEKVKQFLEDNLKKENIDYKSIKEKYTKENTVNDLIEIIK